MATNLNVTTMVLGGEGGSTEQTGDNGTVWSTDCPPGYEGLFCSKCLPGYYKNEYSNIACKKCQSMPKEAEAEGTASYINNSNDLRDSPMCRYECRDDLTPFD